MLVHALVASVWTCPEPTVLLVLDGLDEELAHLVCRGLRVAVLAEYDIAQLLLVPLIHVVLLLALLLFLLLLVSTVGVQAPLLRLALHVQVVGELASLALFAVALLEKLAEHGLGVDTERHLLHLDRLEEFSHLPLGVFRCLLLLLFLRLLGSLALLIWCTTGCSGGVNLLDSLLSGTTLLVLHTEGLVDGDLLHLGRLALSLGRHDGWL